MAARKEWDLKPVQDRAQILFKAADVISGPKRAEIVAKTMIGQVHVTPGGQGTSGVYLVDPNMVERTGISQHRKDPQRL